MTKCGKSCIALLAVLVIGLASCSTPPTTTTTAQPDVPTSAPVSASVAPDLVSAAPDAAAEPQPTHSETAMNDLLGRAEGLKTDANKFGLDIFLPEEYMATDSSFAALKEEYKAATAEGFDGIKASSVKAKLETMVADWESFIARGMPLAAAAAKEKTADARSKALDIGASLLESDRFAKAEELRVQADALLEKGDSVASIPAYRYSASAYDDTREKAMADKSRDKIRASGYAKYSDSYFKMAENKYAEEEAFWKSGNPDDLAAGAAVLGEANSFYDFVVSKGAEYLSFEGKDKAIAAQNAALAAKADANVPDDYSSASDIMAEALSSQGKGLYESAFPWFGDAAAAFGAACDATMILKSADEEAIAAAQEAIQASGTKASLAGFEDNVYIVEARRFMDLARTQHNDLLYSDSRVNASEVLNYSTLSDNFIVAEQARIDTETAERIAAEKALADPVMAGARVRMAWADNIDLKADYPSPYKRASTSMAAAEFAYQNKRYLPSKILAEDVSSILSDDFQSQAQSDRKAAEAAKARFSELAAARPSARSKAAAEAAMAAITEARSRMAWADENKIAADYPGEYKKATTAMGDSFFAYGGGTYPAAIDQAKLVSSTLSDDFQAKVLADRKAAQEASAKASAKDAAAAAARLAADKAAQESAAAAAAAARLAADKAAALLAANPPSVNIMVGPERFSPDGDGENDVLTFKIGTDQAANITDWKLEVFEMAVSESSQPKPTGQGQLFMGWDGKGKPPATISWNGLSPRNELVESATDYPFRFVATNALGKFTTVTGIVVVDVLVIKDGNNLKLKVPSIVFRADYADFVGLAPDTVVNNEKVVARIAQILNRYPNYKIKIQGHANSIAKISGLSQDKVQAEEVNELIPLSTGRANLVMAMLIKNDVDAKRLSVEGLGSSKPVVSFSDADNRWKNRRVEFVLEKSK
ncbi:MAG: OmpA family protein [Spirochaetes bacterium]|nr:OmpA family protein [Spirochaetota bacterium]